MKKEPQDLGQLSSAFMEGKGPSPREKNK